MTKPTPTMPSPRRPSRRLARTALVVSLLAPAAWLVSVLFGAGLRRTVWDSVRWLYAILGADLLLGLIAVVYVAKHRERVGGLDLAVSAVLISVLGLTLGAPAVRGGLHMMRDLGCYNNTEALALALQMYADDYGGRLPPAERWCDCLVPEYERYPAVFVCLEAPRLRCGHALNRALGGASVQEMRASPDADRTVVLYESDLGWNGAGGPGSLVRQPRHRGNDTYLFADGGIRVLPRPRAVGLIWNPAH